MQVFHQRPCLSLLLQLLPYEDGRQLREIMEKVQGDIVWNTHEQMFRVGMELSQTFRLDVVDTLTVILRMFSKHGPHKQLRDQELIQSCNNLSTKMTQICQTIQATTHSLNDRLTEINTSLLVHQELLKENRQLILENQRLIVSVHRPSISIS